jgi:hypothetical protein
MQPIPLCPITGLPAIRRIQPAWSWVVGRACDALFRVPASASRSGLLLIARKPS